MVILYQEMLFDGYFTSGEVNWLFYISGSWMVILYQERLGPGSDSLHCNRFPPHHLW